jgi:23S rRNA (cytidine1920-2'-O)/16S rRNA (cytidine1409-2'-O)-methyltransferase
MSRKLVPAKTRLDVLLVARGLADSRSQALRLVMAGQVRVAGQVMLKPATSVAPDCVIEIDRGPRFVSRGGEKLEAALEAFKLPITGRICADVGASTGGFTDCLLQHGAKRVYAIDVGGGILDWKLRQDERVVVLEKTNVRYLEKLPEPVNVITMDVSFISLKVILPVVKSWFTAPPNPLAEPKGSVVCLIKPQFEAGRHETRRGKGVIRDPLVHRQVLLDVLAFASQQGYAVRGLVRSPLLGPKGNTEFLAWLEYHGVPGTEIEGLVDQLLPDVN